jgi:hypothetical protein
MKVIPFADLSRQFTSPFNTSTDHLSTSSRPPMLELSSLPLS